MNADQASVARKHLECRLSPLRSAMPVAPTRGWVKVIRESLGMTVRQLAARMGVAPSRVPAIEKAEVTGATTLKTLQLVAEAMNCTFVYAFVPKQPLDEILRDRAREKACATVARVNHTMLLEDQALPQVILDAEQKRLVDLFLSGSLRGLWDGEPNPHI